MWVEPAPNIPRKRFCARRFRAIIFVDPTQGSGRETLMSYKDLLVVLDPEPAARGRIDLAAALAERFAAHLVGLYPLLVPQRPRELGYFDPALLDPFFESLREQARAAADEVREQFEHVARLRGLSAEWRLVPEGPDGDPALHARY